jgi:hypothetical protein
MAANPAPRAADGPHSTRSRRRLLASLAALLVALLLWVLGPKQRESRSPRAHRPPAPGASPLPRPAPAALDPLLPPVIQLVVNACATNDAPVELFGRVGAGGWEGGLRSERAAVCDPDLQGQCSFADLPAGRWVVKQGEVAAGLWLKGGPGATRREVELPCARTCSADLVVDADPACGDRGSLRLLPPVPLPVEARPDLGPGVAWTSGQSQRIDHFPCRAAAVTVETARCRQVHALPSPDGAPLRAVRLRLEPLDRVTLRFVDLESGAPIAGVTLKDADRWTVLVSDENGSLEVIQQSEDAFARALLQAHHPDYETTAVYPPSIDGAVGLLPMQRRAELQVECAVDGAPCPGHARLLPTFSSGPPHDPSVYVPGGGIVSGACAWASPGVWRCERGRDFSLTVDLDGRVAKFSAPDGADTLQVDLSLKGDRGCLRGDWPSGDCVLQLAEAEHPLRQPTERVPLPDGEGPAPGRVVCAEAVTWAAVQLDRGGACTEPGPWAELAGICARPAPGPAVEDRVGGGCMLLKAAAGTGEAAGFAASSPMFLERCPSWFPPGEYLVACGEGSPQPVTLVEGEVLEWAPPAP